MLTDHEQLIQQLLDLNVETFQRYQDDRIQDEIQHLFPTMHSLRTFNRNARCFIAVEIENQVSRKHLLGGVQNASVLARVGIVVPWTEEKLRATVKLLQYWDFLRYVEKNTFDSNNVLVLTHEQIEHCLSSGG